MVFKPFPVSINRQTVAAGIGLLLLELLIIAWLVSRPIDGLSFILALLVILSLGPIFYLAYRFYGLLTLEYWIDRDALIIVWGSAKHVIPLPQIRQIVRHAEAEEAVPVMLRASFPGPESLRSADWLRWPALWVGMETVKGFGQVDAFATAPVSRQLLVITEYRTYGISPAQADAFVAALQERYRLGPSHIIAAGTRRPDWWMSPVWRDRLMQGLIGLALLLNLALFGYLAFRFPDLPYNVPLHFDAFGKADRIAERSALFILPLIGLLVLTVNAAAGLWIYTRQRLGAYFLWTGAVLVQILIWLAAQNIVR